MNQLDLNTRHAVITGGASGLGLAIASRMLASGATVSLWDVNTHMLDRALGSFGAAAHAVTVDIARPGSVQKALQQTLRHAGRIDILVNSAGITGPNVKLWEYPEEDWAQVMQVNVNGLFYCCREVVPVMRARDWGRIVNIASVAGKEGNPSAYSASKAAVIALTKSLGKELADTGVRVNCITPAAIRTPIFDQMSQAHIDFMLSKIPMGRFGTTAEVASMVAWLCTEECSFSTAAAFDLSGGRSTY